MSSIVKIDSKGKWQWSNMLTPVNWTVNKENIKKIFSEEEAKIILESTHEGVVVYITTFYMPQRRWMFYPCSLYDYNVENIDDEIVKYKYTETVPKYIIYESMLKDRKWQKAHKIGFCLPRVGEMGNYLYIPISFKDDESRRAYNRSKPYRKGRFRGKNSNMSRGMLTKRVYFIYDVDDDYSIKTNARLMYLRV